MRQPAGTPGVGATDDPLDGWYMRVTPAVPGTLYVASDGPGDTDPTYADAFVWAPAVPAVSASSPAATAVTKCMGLSSSCGVGGWRAWTGLPEARCRPRADWRTDCDMVTGVPPRAAVVVIDRSAVIGL